LEYYQKALPISEGLNTGDSQNIEYRYAASRIYLGIGEALYKLRKEDEALQNLRRAVELQKSIAIVSPERIWNLRVLSRAYTLMAGALLNRGHQDQALDALREGLTVADRILERAPSSLYHQLDRADVLEATGQYYLALAKRPGGGAADSKRLSVEGRACFQKSLAIWQNWTQRNIAAPYSGRRKSQVLAYLTSCDQL